MSTNLWLIGTMTVCVYSYIVTIVILLTCNNIPERVDTYVRSIAETEECQCMTTQWVWRRDTRSRDVASHISSAPVKQPENRSVRSALRSSGCAQSVFVESRDA